ncbi:MAG: YqjF family protein [Thermoleophilaceae bacterium]
MGQSWENLAFLHWPVDRAALARVLPPQIEPDEFDGSAWVGVTPFEVRSFRLRNTLPVPVVSSFPEINVRTYVTRDDKPGIWFMSLDAGSRFAVHAARRAYRLPYHRARIGVRARNGEVDYASRRIGGDAAFTGRYRPVAPVREAQPGSFEHFAAERYCLYALAGDRVMRADIHHRPWPIQAAEAELSANTMARPYGIDLGGVPRVHFARKLDVVIWSLEPDD